MPRGTPLDVKYTIVSSSNPTTANIIENMIRLYGAFWPFLVEKTKDDSPLARKLRTKLESSFEKFIIKDNAGLDNVKANSPFDCPHLREMKDEFEGGDDDFYDEGMEWLSISRFTFRYPEVYRWDIECPENATLKQLVELCEKAKPAVHEAFKKRSKQEARTYLCRLENFWRSLIDEVESEEDVLRLVKDRRCPLF